MLCALSVDNRILTVFKEEKNGRREEIENVEVKLFEPGMYVYALHSSGHDYVTDELWAAFYKKLLEEELVPRIILSSESPGFNWIKKNNYAQAGKSELLQIIGDRFTEISKTMDGRHVIEFNKNVIHFL